MITSVKTLPVHFPLTLLEHQPLKSQVLVQSALNYDGNTQVECGAKDVSTSAYSTREAFVLGA